MKRYPIILFALCLFSCGEAKMPFPSGPLGIGVTSLAFTDPSRAEPYSANPAAKREFMVRVWYPSESTAGCSALPIFTPALKKALSKYMGFPEFALSGGPSNSFIDAPISTASEMWPVIIFSHGAGSFDRQNSIQMEELASQGFIAISMSFPYESMLSEFPDGRLIERSPDGPIQIMQDQMKDPKALAKRQATLYRAIREASNREARLDALAALRAEPEYAAMVPLMETRFADSVYLLDHLDELNALPALSGRLDSSRVGVYGHSLGGGLSIELALRRPDLVKAVVDMDCFVFDSAKIGFTTLTVPTLFMYSTKQRVGSVVLPTDRVNDLYFEESEAPCWSVSYEGTGHYNFSDLGYIDMLKASGMNGPTDGYAVGLLIQKHLLAFFDTYLSGGEEILDFSAVGVRAEGRNQ